MYILRTQIWIIIFKQDTISLAEQSSAWQEKSGISDNGTFLFFWRTGIRARAGFPATIVAPLSRERKSTFTSMISHGRHDANNKDEPLSPRNIRNLAPTLTKLCQCLARLAAKGRSLWSLLRRGWSLPRFSCDLTVAASTYSGRKDPTVSTTLHELFQYYLREVISTARLPPTLHRTINTRAGDGDAVQVYRCTVFARKYSACDCTPDSRQYRKINEWHSWKDNLFIDNSITRNKSSAF